MMVIFDAWRLSLDNVMSDHMHDICLVDPPESCGNPVVVGSVGPCEGVLTNREAERFARELVRRWNSQQQLLASLIEFVQCVDGEHDLDMYHRARQAIATAQGRS